MTDSIFIVGYKTYGECGCDVDKVFHDKEHAEIYCNEQNSLYRHEDTNLIGYIVKEFEIN